MATKDDCYIIIRLVNTLEMCRNVVSKIPCTYVISEIEPIPNNGTLKLSLIVCSFTSNTIYVGQT